MVTRPKYIHALLTSEKPLIRYDMMDFCTREIFFCLINSLFASSHTGRGLSMEEMDEDHCLTKRLYCFETTAYTPETNLLTTLITTVNFLSININHQLLFDKIYLRINRRQEIHTQYSTIFNMCQKHTYAGVLPSSPHS